jgi:hypothetical protein
MCRADTDVSRWWPCYRISPRTSPGELPPSDSADRCCYVERGTCCLSSYATHVYSMRSQVMFGTDAWTLHLGGLLPSETTRRDKTRLSMSLIDLNSSSLLSYRSILARPHRSQTRRDLGMRTRNQARMSTSSSARLDQLPAELTLRIAQQLGDGVQVSAGRGGVCRLAGGLP